MATVFSSSLPGTSGGWGGGYTQRNVTITALSSGSLGQVRVTFQAHSSAALVMDHCSIGVSTGSAPFTDIVGTFGSATFQELKFAGISGFSIGAAATKTSDWVNLTFSISDKLVVVMDLNASVTSLALDFTSFLANMQYHNGAGGASYNQATTPSGSSGITDEWDSIALIETQASPSAFLPPTFTQSSIMQVRKSGFTY